MGRLTNGMLVSLDGYVSGPDGGIDWTEPDPVLHEHFNEIQADTTVDLYGRRMWEMMRYWQDPPAEDLGEPRYRGFAEAWRATDHVVVSCTLTEAEVMDVPRTRLWPELDLERLRALVAESEGDVSVSGPTLAAQALRAGLVDRVSAYVVPHVTGGGLPFLPSGYTTPLRLRTEHRFPGGTVGLVYDVCREDAPGQSGGP